MVETSHMGSEVAARSGSLITARDALEQGREVFAVPGSPLDPRAEGTNHLLKQGATLVTEVSAVIDVLKPLIGRAPDSFAEDPEPFDAGDRPRIRRAISAAASFRCSVRPRSRSTTWCGYPAHRSRSSAWCCSTSTSLAAWSGMATASCRCFDSGRARVVPGRASLRARKDWRRDAAASSGAVWLVAA
jgi:hypothetical protein